MWRSLRDHPHTLWGLLALPGVAFLLLWLASGHDGAGRSATALLLHPTGELSARLMIVTMAISPMRHILPSSDLWRWMRRRRRYFGVAAFGYALLHTALYLADTGSPDAVMSEVALPAIWTGWLAFILLVPLALTSNDAMLFRLGRYWRILQRLTYPAALAILAHWLLIHDGAAAALVHFGLLATLQVLRLRNTLKPMET